MSIYYKNAGSWNNMALDFYPVGSFYQGGETSPAEIFSGTWVRVFSNPTLYEGLLSNLNNVISNQRWPDILVQGYVRSGTVTINVARNSSTASAVIQNTPDSNAIVGTIAGEWRPQLRLDCMMGTVQNGSGWLTLTIDPNGSIYVWSRYSASAVTVAGFSGTLSYPVKQLGANSTTVIWKRIS